VKAGEKGWKKTGFADKDTGYVCYSVVKVNAFLTILLIPSPMLLSSSIVTDP